MTMIREISASIPLLLVLTSSARAAGLADSPALPGAAVPEGVTLRIAADHAKHQLTSPTALAFDAAGRIFVTETHRFAHGVEDDRAHLYWYLDDLAARTIADRRKLHEKWREKLPLERMTEKSEIVRRLADTDGDGTPDESKVFADGFNDVLDGTAAGIFEYEGAVYLGCIPKLLMLRDADGDGRAEERKTIEEGFGVRVSLSGHDLNGFALGPDGRIYGTIGDRGLNLTTKEGIRLEYPNQGAVFRFEPDGSGFELFHTGLRNPKEIAFDALGTPITVDNNSDQKDRARIVHLLEGGDSGWEMEHQTMFSFHRQIGLEELPPSRWMDERMWETANAAQPAYVLPPIAYLTSGPSGLTYHPGAGFLENEADRFLICDYRGSAATSGIWSFAVKPDGAGLKLADARKLVTGVAATDAEYSWDGRLFVTDFGGGWKSHADGRLLSLEAADGTWRAREAAGAARLMREGLENRGSAELANLLKHPDARIRLRAQIALTRKPDALQRFSDATLSSDLMTRVHGIWGLGILARRGATPLPYSEFGSIPSATLRKDAEKKLVELLKDKNDEVRCQTLRALVDASTRDGGAPIQVGPLLADPSPRVRYHAALLAGKRRMIGYYGPICDMLAENDNRDPALRHAGIFALQHLVPNSDTLRALSTHPSSAVRLAAVVALRRMKSPDVAEFLRDEDTKVADEAIRAVCDTDMTGQRPAAAALLDDAGSRQWSPFMLRRLLHNSFRIGDAENAARVLKIAADAARPEALRAEAFRLLSCWTRPFPADQFTGHWRPLPARNPEVVVPLLAKELPGILERGDALLAAALGLAETYQIKVPGLDEARLRGWVTDAALPENARAKALEQLIARKPDDLADFLKQCLRDTPDDVTLAALRHLVSSEPAEAAAHIGTTLASGRAKPARESWKLLAGIPGAEADALFVTHLEKLRASSGISPFAIELIEAARTREAPRVKEALAALEKSLEENPDPLARWNIALEGGDPAEGKALFVSHPAAECMRCHRLGDDGHDLGGETAPNLAGLARRRPDRRYFLESLVRPSAVIAPGFGAVAIDFKNGASLGGNLLARTDDHLDLESKGRVLRVRRDDVAGITEPVSAMPPMGDLLKPAELRDLIAWLGSLDEETAAAPAPPEPEAFDPATLAPAAGQTATLDPETLKTGRTQYIVCGACHGPNGEGGAAGPPLAGSEWVNGPAENLIRIQLRGLKGPITVKGVTYDFPAGMAALAYQTDEQIAAVLSYVRSSFGNQAPPVTAAEVATLRSEVGKPPLTAADLTAPAAGEKPAPQAAAPPTSDYSDLKPASPLPKWIAGIAVLLGLVLIFLKLRKNP